MTTRADAETGYPALAAFIDGKWVTGRGERPVADPTTGRQLGLLPLCGDEQVELAVAAAARTFVHWSQTPARDRASVLHAAAAWLRGRQAEWAGLIALEMGKPLAQAQAEVATACDMFDWAAAEAQRLYGREIPSRALDLRLSVRSDPAGPVAAITGWNAPALSPARKVAGALAAGCSVVLKPSEATPASALMIARSLETAGLPPGVLNIVFGDPPVIGRCLAEHPAIRMLTFTGGTAVGKQIAALATGTMKRVVLELGGHAPVLVFADADVDTVAAAAALAKFRNAGQICTAPTRFLVERAALPHFAQGFAEAMRATLVGDPFHAATGMGPVANAARHAAVEAMIADAERHGGTVLRGTAPQGRGHWCAPALVTGAARSSRAWNEEPFGPIALLAGFDTADEAIAEANRLPAGLAAYAATGRLDIAERLAREIQAGVLAINHWTASWPETPFGGVKDSGLGLEGGSEGLAAFRQTRLVSVRA